MQKNFYRMVAGIRNPKDAENFFRDLLTPSESLMLTRRIEIAKLLLEGYNFEEIKVKLKVGFNTINIVNRWLFSGFGGYLNEIKKSKSMKEFHESVPSSDWRRIKMKYPAHFLIFNLIDRFKR